MEKKKLLDYVLPQVKVTKVSLELSIAQTTPVSAAGYMGSDWVEVNDPVGGDTDLEGGDIFVPL